jgi:(1->4)-alpha-D-glucan 1-alpha-D-glucosylmutase
MSEDARARLFALAELPYEWESHLCEWHELNLAARREIGGRFAPDAREEYLLYQALLAAWPLELSRADDELRSRLKGYFHKVQGEAKINTSWTYPHADWLAAGAHFIDALLDSSLFMESFLPFARRIAQRGMVFSLAQTVLKLTSPGVPDLYQGNEVWDFSLVDPDNRRPVDFAHCRTLLQDLPERTPADLLENWSDGGIKLQVVRALLACRAEFPELFSWGDYIPLIATGTRASSMVTFLRRHGSAELLIAVPRRLTALEAPALGKAWGNTRIVWEGASTWTNLLTQAIFTTREKGISVAELFADWPVAVLLRH